MLEVLRRARLPASRGGAFASERSAGQAGRVRGWRARVPAARRRDDPGPRPGALLGRRRGERRVGAAACRRRARSSSTTPASGGCTRTCRWSSPRSTRTRPSATTGIIANPNCSTMQMVVALAPIQRRGRDRADRRLHLPVGLGHRPAGGRRAARPGARACSSEQDAGAEVYPHRIAFNVLPQVETFKDGDDYTTEERKLMAETRKILERRRRGSGSRPPAPGCPCSSATRSR